MKEYIDKGALYDKTAEWEASAFAYIEELNRTPLEEMSEDEKAEWRRWTAILRERSAFKFDVADAPTADVRENVHAHWEIVYDEDCDDGGKYICGNCRHAFSFGAYFELCRFDYCPNCGAQMGERREDG